MSSWGTALVQGEGAQIRWRDAAPLAFLWQERLYMVRRVTGRGPGLFRVVAAAGRSGPTESFELTLDIATGTWTIHRLREDEPVE